MYLSAKQAGWWGGLEEVFQGVEAIWRWSEQCHQYAVDPERCFRDEELSLCLLPCTGISSLTEEMRDWGNKGSWQERNSGMTDRWSWSCRSTGSSYSSLQNNSYHFLKQCILFVCLDLLLKWCTHCPVWLPLMHPSSLIYLWAYRLALYPPLVWCVLLSLWVHQKSEAGSNEAQHADTKAFSPLELFVILFVLGIKLRPSLRLHITTQISFIILYCQHFHGVPAASVPSSTKPPP